MELLFAAPGLHHSPRTPSSSSSSSSAIAAKPAAEAATPLPDVVAALERATLAVKHLSASAALPVDASLALLPLASLRSAYQVIGSFLAQLDPRPPPAAGGDGGDEPMPDQVVAEEDGSRDVEEVEERMREWGLGSKRRRTMLVPPSWTTGRVEEQESRATDPIDRRRWAMELVFQFHG